MRASLRVFPSRLSPRERRVYRAVTVFYILLFFALLWPVYPRFSGLEPRVLGMPFSLAYVVTGVVLSFLVLFALFKWEERNPSSRDPAGGRADGASAGAGDREARAAPRETGRPAGGASPGEESG